MPAPFVRTVSPPRTFCMVSSTWTAWLIARRTRTFITGVFDARPAGPMERLLRSVSGSWTAGRSQRPGDRLTLQDRAVHAARGEAVAHAVQ